MVFCAKRRRRATTTTCSSNFMMSEHLQNSTGKCQKQFIVSEAFAASMIVRPDLPDDKLGSRSIKQKVIWRMHPATQTILDYASPASAKPRRLWLPPVLLSLAFIVWYWPR